ncbi:MAG: hypothetical protein M0P11_07775, partial [Anaerolineaceae bacterium]|nr:hypothetical protein [Anaerolineaceae bacterium]
MNNVANAINYFHDNQKRMTDSYLDLIRIPSISNDADRREDMARAANFLHDYLGKIGFEKTEIFPTALHPIVFAEKKSADPSAKTLLIYGHYDVQPVDPLDEW